MNRFSWPGDSPREDRDLPLGLCLRRATTATDTEVDGLPESTEPYVELRDTRTHDEDELADVEGYCLHLHPERGGATGSA